MGIMADRSALHVAKHLDCSLTLFGLVMMSTFFVQTVLQVSALHTPMPNLTSGHIRHRVGRNLLGYRLLGVSRNTCEVSTLPDSSPFA